MMYFKADSILTQKFNKSGIKNNEKIAVLSSNSEEYVKLLIHIFNLNAIAVPLNPMFPVSKIHQVLNDINCKMVIVDEKSNYKDVCGIKSVPLDFFIDGLKQISLKNLIETFNVNKLHENFNKYLSIIFTSGSEGRPKAVLHTVACHYFSASGSNDNIQFKKDDCWLILLPLNHVSGFSTIFKALISKADIAVKPPDLSLFEIIKKYKATHLSLIPSQLSELINSPAGVKVLKKMKAILIGGAPASPRLIEESSGLKLPIYKSYGSTEMASQITCTLKDDTLRHLKTSGKLLKYREIKTDVNGEILVKGKTLFKGYIKKDASGKEILNMPFDEEGWFKTSDKGYIDNEGYLHVYGRKDFMFFYKGENIFPEEIENHLKELSGIEDAIVVSVCKDMEGQVPVAFIKSKDNYQIDFESIRKSLQKNIESFKIPVLYLKWPEDEKITLHKPDRKKFKKIAEQLITDLKLSG
ncbi:MAG: o-succinylbenzoate--CoA ligase [Actinobacteria bacterium]|nr:o-succinylbenzoate--CoA ligase [Actinomycetota bacterium]